MKKLIFTLAIAMMVCSSGNLFAQSSDRMSEVKAFAQQHFQKDGESVYEPDSMIYHISYTGYENNKTIIYSYDEQCRLFQEVLKLNHSKMELTTYGYSSVDMVSSTLLQNYGEDDILENVSNQSFTYDFENKIQDILTQKWENDTWVNEKKVSYTYNGNVDSVQFSEWSGAWNPVELYIISYSSDGYSILKKRMNGNTWENRDSIVVTLNENHSIVNESTYSWIASWGAWAADCVIEYTYDDLVYTSIDYYHDGGSVKFLTIEYEYDNRGNATHATFTYFEEHLMGYVLDFQLPYDNNTKCKEIIVPFGKLDEVTMTYADIFLSTNEMAETTAFSLYPNPANDMISVDGEGFEKAEIYNIAGQKVMESSNAQIDVKALQAGVYMVKVFGNGSSEMLRVVVK